MFEPGHLHRANPVATPDQPTFSIDLNYEVRQDPVEGPMLHMHLVGEVAGKAFEEQFELHRQHRRLGDGSSAVVKLGLEALGAHVRELRAIGDG
jgi:hypothetical protein